MMQHELRHCRDQLHIYLLAGYLYLLGNRSTGLQGRQLKVVFLIARSHKVQPAPAQASCWPPFAVRTSDAALVLVSKFRLEKKVTQTL